MKPKAFPTRSSVEELTRVLDERAPLSAARTTAIGKANFDSDIDYFKVVQLGH
jgi:hypothetical protein